MQSLQQSQNEMRKLDSGQLYEVQVYTVVQAAMNITYLFELNSNRSQPRIEPNDCGQIGPSQ